MTTDSEMNRRSFLKASVACSTHLALMAAPFPLAARALWSNRNRGQVAVREPFGRLEQVGEGLWALVSTPLSGDYTTVCNGGIIAGRTGTLLVEAFQTPQGAAWMAGKARELTGRWPTHVLVTHYHGDHTGGVEGCLPGMSGPGERTDFPGDSAAGPHVHATETTAHLCRERLPDDAPDLLRSLWADVAVVPSDAPSTLELGSRYVQFHPRRGHTASDVTVEVPDARITWCGDLVWNGMFPNYMDAEPSRLSRAVRALRAEGRDLYVPGHGPLADGADMDRYLAVIDGVEETARRARQEGWTAEEAGRRHRIPESLGEWTLFNPTYFQRAVEAWMKEWAR